VDGLREDGLTAYLRIPNLLPKELEDSHFIEDIKQEYRLADAEDPQLAEAIEKGIPEMLAIMNAFPEQSKIQSRCSRGLYRAVVAHAK